MLPENAVHRTRMRWLRNAAIVLVALVSACEGWCDRDRTREQRLTAAEQETLRRRMRTPCDTEAALDSAFVTALAPLVISSTRLNHNELHDCQRLIVPGDSFGPLAAIYVSAELDKINFGDLRDGRILAEVVNWGAREAGYPGTHPELKLTDSTTYCLGVRRDPSGGGTWSAAMFPAPEGTCRDVEYPDDVTTNWRLYVRARRHSGDNSRIPGTARWGWKNGLQYIGIRCGPAWCEIADSRVLNHPPTLPGPGVREVPGWYDEQRLAVKKNGKLYPSNLLGKITPHPNLGTFRKSIHFKDTEQEVADIELAGIDPAAEQKYLDSLNLSTTIRNTIFIQFDSVNRKWMARGNTSGPLVPIDDPKQHLDPSHHLGIVRWQWRADDDGIWIECDAGCCEIQRLRSP